MSQPLEPAPPSPPPVAHAVPLDYAPTHRRPGVAVRWLIGIFSTLLLSCGLGAIVFGTLIAARFRDDPASIIAIGVTCSLMGAGLLVTAWTARR